MGYGKYSHEDRTVRAMSAGFYTKSFTDISTQTKERKIHDSMNPKNIIFREACDSAEHPNVTPIQFYLDVTGSMGSVPNEMIKDGLPTLIGRLTQNGVSDVALMFGAIGDHECDQAPLQVAQFESGDKELDMWLTRVWLEGNGGGNYGESYLLAWYFAGHHVRTDAFDKRNKKGFVFTIGDEPCLQSIPMTALKEIMGNTATGQGTWKREDLLKKAQEYNHVYHIFLTHNGRRTVDQAWRDLLGQNLLVVADHTEVSKTISDIVLSHQDAVTSAPVVTSAPSAALEDIKITL